MLTFSASAHRLHDVLQDVFMIIEDLERDFEIRMMRTHQKAAPIPSEVKEDVRLQGCTNNEHV